MCYEISFVISLDLILLFSIQTFIVTGLKFIQSNQMLVKMAVA
jgi:hypothetical protein